MANTRGEGNLSNDGRYYAVAERYYNYETGEVTYNDLAVYDIADDRIISRMTLPQDQLEDFDWVSISPLDNYVVVDYASWQKGRYRGMEVYDRNFNLIWQKGLGPGHSDMGLDANGDEVLIIDIYSDNDNMTHICKFKLANGDSTELLKTSYLFDMHESCRAMSRSGNRVIFGSNWRFAMNEEASIDVYLVDLRNLITGTPEIAVGQDGRPVKVFPNPVTDHLIITCRDGFTSGKLTISDQLGRTLKEVPVNEINQMVDLSALPPGIYYYRVMDSKGASLDTGKLVKL